MRIAFGFGIFSVVIMTSLFFARPRIAFDPPEFSSFVPPGSLISTSVEFHNRGIFQLTVSDFTSDCTCTVPDSGFLRIEGGKSSQLPVKILIPEGDKAHKFQIFFRSNDIFQPRGIAEVNLVAEYGAKVSPRRLVMFPDSSDFREGHGEVLVSVSDGRPDLKLLH